MNCKITNSYDGELRVWSAMAGICIAVLKGHRDFVRSLAVDATRIVSGDFGGYIRVCVKRRHDCINEISAAVQTFATWEYRNKDALVFD